MAAGNPIRGSRIGAGRMGEADRGESAPRQRFEFFCANGHMTTLAFAMDAEVPDVWDCPRCGFPAGQDSGAPPPATRVEPYKSHLAYVKERRSDEDGEALLAEALARIEDKRTPRF
ncbi:RNA polymerase-binding protein RbpA [Nakamurella sp.]|uniref:RNA polymerase-binding protein RbpA n=1 Tax=Nakamurella sp. TaxID=1869182 RepID=UPI003785058A